LKWVVRRRPQLRCYVLIWDHAALYTLERDPFTRWRFGWRMPRHVRLAFDDHHPIGGSHHQKLVVVDDVLAFGGGIDLTGHRWDTPAHRLHEPARINANGSPYEPYHEVGAMVDGPAAASLGDLVRERWHALGERPRRRHTKSAALDLWPEGIEADLTKVDVAIARTLPPSERDAEGIRECEHLYLDSIAAATRTIYIESQYFTNDELGRALGARLEEPDGPEVIVVVPKECHGWLEQQTMGAMRGEVLGALAAADRHQRLRIVYPAASQAENVSTFVHSKVMIVDDRLVRIGSANLSRRSMGVDSECDLAAEAGDDEAHRAGVLRIRDRLLGEHLGLDAGAVAAEVARLGSLRALIDARAGVDRTLLPVDLTTAIEPASDVVKALADPIEPISVTTGATDVIPPLDARAGRGSLRVWLSAIAVGVALLAVHQLWFRGVSIDAGLLDVPRTPIALGLAVGAFLVAQFALVPLEIVAVLAGFLLGGSTGALVGTAGALVSAVAGYLVGRAMGGSRLASWMSRRAYRSARQLSARGVLGVAVLRLTSIASGNSVDLICGAAKVPFLAYMVGSILGLMPVVLVLSGVGSLIRAAVLQPGWTHGFEAVAGVLGAGVLALAVRSLLLMRQFSPTLRQHRERAEFG
jgi:phosphatidylserine/phosphatidylglycerophosphate/cardiolipin synthase-like enzyme/uncharacterized membrane protein YdjX (TVP38/TMEM64 family)